MDRSKPACMTEREYEEWQARNAECRWQANSPCSDCPLEWALEQEQRGNCLVWNGVDYVLGSPRGDERPMPKAEQQRRYRRRTGQKTISNEYAHAARRRDAVRLVGGGLSIGQVATRMGLHRNTVRRYLREAAA